MLIVSDSEDGSDSSGMGEAGGKSEPGGKLPSGITNIKNERASADSDERRESNPILRALRSPSLDIPIASLGLQQSTFSLTQQKVQTSSIGRPGQSGSTILDSISLVTTSTNEQKFIPRFWCIFKAKRKRPLSYSSTAINNSLAGSKRRLVQIPDDQLLAHWKSNSTVALAHHDKAATIIPSRHRKRGRSRSSGTQSPKHPTTKSNILELLGSEASPKRHKPTYRPDLEALPRETVHARSTRRVPNPFFKQKFKQDTPEQGFRKHYDRHPGVVEDTNHNCSDSEENLTCGSGFIKSAQDVYLFNEHVTLQSNKPAASKGSRPLSPPNHRGFYERTPSRDRDAERDRDRDRDRDRERNRERDLSPEPQQRRRSSSRQDRERRRSHSPRSRSQERRSSPRSPTTSQSVYGKLDDRSGSVDSWRSPSRSHHSTKRRLSDSTSTLSSFSELSDSDLCETESLQVHRLPLYQGASGGGLPSSIYTSSEDSEEPEVDLEAGLPPSLSDGLGLEDDFDLESSDSAGIPFLPPGAIQGAFSLESPSVPPYTEFHPSTSTPTVPKDSCHAVNQAWSPVTAVRGSTQTDHYSDSEPPPSPRWDLIDIVDSPSPRNSPSRKRRFRSTRSDYSVPHNGADASDLEEYIPTSDERGDAATGRYEVGDYIPLTEFVCSITSPTASTYSARKEIPGTRSRAEEDECEIDDDYEDLDLGPEALSSDKAFADGYPPRRDETNEYFPHPQALCYNPTPGLHDEQIPEAQQNSQEASKSAKTLVGAPKKRHTLSAPEKVSSGTSVHEILPHAPESAEHSAHSDQTNAQRLQTFESKASSGHLRTHDIDPFNDFPLSSIQQGSLSNTERDAQEETEMDLDKDENILRSLINRNCGWSESFEAPETSSDELDDGFENATDMEDCFSAPETDSHLTGEQEQAPTATEQISTSVPEREQRSIDLVITEYPKLFVPNPGGSGNILIQRQFGCPFLSTGDPEYRGCHNINRKDLAGLREHIKRRHKAYLKEKDIPWSDLLDHNTPTWQDIFRRLFPVESGYTADSVSGQYVYVYVEDEIAMKAGGRKRPQQTVFTVAEVAGMLELAIGLINKEENTSVPGATVAAELPGSDEKYLTPSNSDSEDDMWFFANICPSDVGNIDYDNLNSDALFTPNGDLDFSKVISSLDVSDIYPICPPSGAAYSLSFDLNNLSGVSNLIGLPSNPLSDLRSFNENFAVDLSAPMFAGYTAPEISPFGSLQSFGLGLNMTQSPYSQPCGIMNMSYSNSSAGTGSILRNAGYAAQLPEESQTRAIREFKIEVRQRRDGNRNNKTSRVHKTCFFKRPREVKGRFTKWLEKNFCDPPFDWNRFELQSTTGTETEIATGEDDVMADLEFDAHRDGTAKYIIVPRKDVSVGSHPSREPIRRPTYV